jgi:Collagen triple helix repeat (20 copies)
MVDVPPPLTPRVKRALQTPTQAAAIPVVTASVAAPVVTSVAAAAPAAVSAAVTGPVGFTGASGVQGPTGPAGRQGVPGAMGSQGMPGPKGDTGAMGPAGGITGNYSGTVTIANPGALALDVVGNVLLENATSNILVSSYYSGSDVVCQLNDNTVNNTYAIDFRSDNPAKNSFAAIVAQIKSVTNNAVQGDLNFMTANAATAAAIAMTINASGGVSIGSTPSDPGANNLAVQGSVSAAGMSLTQTTSGSPGGDVQILYINHADNSVMGSYYIYPLLVNEVLNNSAITGIRPGSTFQLLFEQQTSNVSNSLNFYCALSTTAIAGAPDNGTSGAPLGFLYGANPSASLNSGATHWAGVIGADIIAAIKTGASAVRRIGVTLESQGNVAGSLIDAAVDIFANVSGIPWNIGILFDDSQNINPTANGPYPIAAGGTLIKGAFGSSTSVTLANGVDLSACLFSGAAFKSPGFSVDGAGDVISNASSRILATSSPSAGGVVYHGYLLYGGTLGLYAGSGNPTLSVSKGSIYLETGVGQLWINTSGGSTWTQVSVP